MRSSVAARTCASGGVPPRALEDLVAHAGEDVFDLAADTHQGMDAAERQLASGERDVHSAGGWPAGAERGPSVVERRFNLTLQLVDERTNFAPALGGQAAKLFEEAGDRPGLTAQELVVKRLEFGVRTRRRDARAEVRAQRLER